MYLNKSIKKKLKGQYSCSDTLTTLSNTCGLFPGHVLDAFYETNCFNYFPIIQADLFIIVYTFLETLP